MKTILIPTDYQLSTFDCVPALCQQLKGQELKLVFLHMFKLSDSISELLLLNRRNREYEKVSDAFYNQLKEVRAQFPLIKEVRIEFLYGSTLSMLKNFLEANEVAAVLDTKSCSFNPIHRYSINPDVLMEKSGLPVLTLAKTQTRDKRVLADVEAYHHELLTEV